MRAIASAHMAASVLSVPQERLAVSANNTANLHSDGFEAQRVISQEDAAGGVKAVIDPSHAPHPVGFRDGIVVSLSNSEFGADAISMLGAQRALEANLSVVRTQDESLGTILSTRG